MAKYKFDKKKPYRLIAVTDKTGRDKTDMGDFYDDILNCTAVNLHFDEYPKEAERQWILFKQTKGFGVSEVYIPVLFGMSR